MGILNIRTLILTDGMDTLLDGTQSLEPILMQALLTTTILVHIV